MKRSVTRTYFSKKKQEWITKVYNYTHTSRKGKVLVGKNGVVNKKNVEAFKEQIKNREDLTSQEKNWYLNDLDVEVYTRHQMKKKLTTNGFMGMESDDKINRLLSNLGTDPYSLADELGIDPNEILNEENWKGDTFEYAGTIYGIQFSYTGNILVPTV